MITRIFRTVLVLIAVLVFTTSIGLVAIAAGLLGVKDRPNGIYDWVPRNWSRLMLWAAGARVFVHGEDQVRGDEPHIFVANHLSWFDIPALAGYLPRYKFVAKAALFKCGALFGARCSQLWTADSILPFQRCCHPVAYIVRKLFAVIIAQASGRNRFEQMYIDSARSHTPVALAEKLERAVQKHRNNWNAGCDRQHKGAPFELAQGISRASGTLRINHHGIAFLDFFCGELE